MNSHFRVVPLAAALTVLVTLAVAPARGTPALLAPEAVHPGDRAVVRTVFEGARIDSFEAVILGTLDAGRSQGVTILGRATSENAIRTGIAQGMSGSPVYVGGKLIGALSSGYAYSREPIFGVTPIGEMLAVLDHPDLTREGDASTGMSGAEPSAMAALPRFREMRWANEVAPTQLGVVPGSSRNAIGEPALPGAAGSLTRLAIPLACGGMNPLAADLVNRWLGPLGLAAVPGGRSTGTGPGAEALVPGAPVAIDLLRGDLQMTAIGTVTWREGDRILIFGHPLFQAGDVRMPLATATITTIVPSGQISFKLGNRGREVGAITQDRRPAVAGVIGPVARLLPFRVDVVGTTAAPKRFHFEMIEDRTLAPLIAGIAGVNTLLESGGTGAGQTVDWTLRLHRSGAPPLELHDVIAGDSPVNDLATAIGAPLRFLMGNPYERLRLDSLEITLKTTPRREAWTLRSARLLESSVKPGSMLHVDCELEAWRGGIQHRTLELPVAEELPDGRYALWIGGGTELSRFEAARLPGRYHIESLDDGWRRLAATRSSDALYLALTARAPEVTTEGRDYPELPLFAVSLMADDASAGERIRRGDLAWLALRRVPVPGALRGELQLNVVVESHGSLAQP